MQALSSRVCIAFMLMAITLAQTTTLETTSDLPITTTPTPSTTTSLLPTTIAAATTTTATTTTTTTTTAVQAITVPETTIAEASTTIAAATTTTAVEATTVPETTIAELTTTVPVAITQTEPPTTTTTRTTSVVTTTPAPASRLNVSIVGPESLFAGQTGVIEYFARVCNNPSGGRAQNVVINLQLPSGMFQVGLASGSRLECSGQGMAVCTLTGQLAANTCVEARVVVYVFTTELQPLLEIVAWATTTSQPPETLAGALKTVAIRIQSDLQLNRFSSVVAVAGRSQFYEIVVTNDGPSQAYNVTLTTTSFYPITSWTAQLGASCTLSVSAKVLTCKIAELPADTQTSTRGMAVSVLYSVPRNETPTVQFEGDAPSANARPIVHSLTAGTSTVAAQPISRRDTIDVRQISALAVTANCSITQSGFTLTNAGPSDCSRFEFMFQTVNNRTVVPSQCTLDSSTSLYTCVGRLAVGESFFVLVPGVTNDTVTASVRSASDPELSDNQRSCKLGQLVVPVNANERLVRYDAVSLLSNNIIFRWSVVNGSVISWLVQCTPTESLPLGAFVQLGWAAAPFGAPENNGSWIGGNASLVTTPVRAWTGAYSAGSTGQETQGAVLFVNDSYFMWGLRSFGEDTESLMITVGCPTPAVRTLARWSTVLPGVTLVTANMNLRAGSVVTALPSSVTAHAVLMTVAWFAGLVLMLFLMMFAEKFSFLPLVVLLVSAALAIAGFVIGIIMSPILFSASASRSMGAHGIIGLIAFIWLLLQCILSIIVVLLKRSMLRTLELVSGCILLVLGVISAFLGVYDWSVNPGWYGLLAGWLGLMIIVAVIVFLLLRMKAKRGSVPQLRQYFNKSMTSTTGGGAPVESSSQPHASKNVVIVDLSSRTLPVQQERQHHEPQAVVMSEHVTVEHEKIVVADVDVSQNARETEQQNHKQIQHELSINNAVAEEEISISHGPTRNAATQELSANGGLEDTEESKDE